MTSGLWVAAVVLLTGTVAAGQAARPVAPRQASTAADTARLAGIVVDHAGYPVRLAIVTVAGDGLAASLSRISDDDGRFVFEALPSGRFSLTAVKAAHITSSFGAKRPGRPGTLLTVADGDVRDDVELVLPRGAVITGIVRDTLGRPLPDADVIVFPADGPVPVGGPASYLARSMPTDDRGRYRFFGLDPDDYYVVAGQRMVGAGPLSVMSDDESRPVAWVPTYFPGTPERAAAAHVSVEAGDVRDSIDFALVLAPAATVAGVVTAPPGVPMESISVALTAAEVEPRMRSTPISALLWPPRPDAEGRFAMPGVAPGRYLLTAQWRRPPRGGGPPTTMGSEPDLQWAMTELVVAGADIAGIGLSLQPGLSVRGRMIFDGLAAPPEGFETSRLTVMSALTGSPPGLGLRNPGFTASLGADASFAFPGLMPGQYAVSGTTPPGSEWWLRSAMADGIDALDHGLNVAGDMRDLVATWTRRRTGLGGTLTTASGLPASDYFVVIFPDDASLWRENARRIRVARPADNGTYEFERLPPGQYRVAALTDVEYGEWNHPAFLELLLPASLVVTIGDDEPTRFDIRLGSGN